MQKKRAQRLPWCATSANWAPRTRSMQCWAAKNQVVGVGTSREMDMFGTSQERLQLFKLILFGVRASFELVLSSRSSCHSPGRHLSFAKPCRLSSYQ